MIVSAAASYQIIIGTTKERVVAKATIKGIVTVSAIQNIVLNACGEAIGKGGARCLRDMSEYIAVGIASGADACGQIEGDRRRRRRIVDHIITAAPFERVSAQTRNKGVVALAAIEGCGRTSSRQFVVE